MLLSGRQAFDAFLRGYGEVEPGGRDVERALRLYAVIWYVQANAWELGAGGSWFAHRVEWIDRHLRWLDA
jgi:hypothetical protein